LRRNEVLSLDLAHFDGKRSAVSIKGKGRTEREWVTLPASTKAALDAWIAMRGTEEGPLFTSVDVATQGHRLTGAALYKVIRCLGAAEGFDARPHGLRHAAITEALEKTNGNVRAVQRFSRHRDINVLTVYDDNRSDLGGQIAAMVAL
jgi:integrase/recombinase XerC